VGKPEGRRPLRKPRHRWEDNIKCVVEKSDRDMYWTYLAQDKDRLLAFVTTVINLQIP
jgi:hypothetical protein